MRIEDVYSSLLKKIRDIQVSGGGVTNYNDLSGQPKINGVTLEGNKTSEDLKIKQPDTLPNPESITFGGILPNVSYDGNEQVNVTFPNAEMTGQSAGTPVGEIMAYMGKTAPPHYLICDGSVYNISDYPELSQFIAEGYSSVNHFGGDGLTTFAVPDLRNEFLRGYHGDNTEQLSGEIGEHQNATVHTSMLVYNNNISVNKTNNNTSGQQNTVFNDGFYWDKNIASRKYATRLSGTNTANDDGYPANFTSRPTNVAVLFVIKAEPTYFVQIDNASSISKEPGNIIVEKPDGIYAPNVKISDEANNAIENRDDGLYVAKETVYTDTEIEAAVMGLFYPGQVENAAATEDELLI